MNISPKKLPLSQSLWLRLVHVIEQREENITRVNSLIRQFGSPKRQNPPPSVVAQELGDHLLALLLRQVQYAEFVPAASECVDKIKR